jgi:hypothetical protein
VKGVLSNPMKYALETSGVRFASEAEQEKANPS